MSPVDMVLEGLPHSIDVWVCPACERAHSHQAGQTASSCGCTGWDAAGVRRVRATYVLSEVSDEMVERAPVMGLSAESDAALVLRRFMCCEAGREFVLQEVIEPFLHTDDWRAAIAEAVASSTFQETGGTDDGA